MVLSTNYFQTIQYLRIDAYRSETKVQAVYAYMPASADRRTQQEIL